MRSRTCTTLALALVGIVSLRSQEPQPQPPVLRSGVQAVQIDARVFDGQGRFVGDLGPEDFEILEDGVAQRVQTVFLVGDGDRHAAPNAAPARGAVPDADAGPKPRAARASARQTWIFVFDLNHLTPGAGFERARKAVEDFIGERFRDGDLAGVVAGSKMVNNRLTSVREELLAAVKSVKPLTDLRSRQVEMAREWPRLLDENEVVQIANEQRDALDRAVLRACTEDPVACSRVPPDLQIREKARRLQQTMRQMTAQTLTAVNALASGLARIPGPKTIVLLSDGFVTAEMETMLRSVVGQVARSGGRVYAIDVRGLNRGRGAGIIDQPVVVDEAGGFTQFDAQEDGPNSLAIDTGGMTIRNENNIGRALDTIAADANRYYLLGYEPANANWDGTFRSVTVRVRREGVRVRARRGYLALEPARILVPEPVKPADGEPVGPTPPAREPPREMEALPGIPVLPPAGPVGPLAVASPVSAPPGVRLRPDRIRELSGGEPAHAGAAAAKGWEAYQLGDLEAAVAHLTQAAADPNVRPWVLYTLGLAHVGLGRPRDAVDMWERVRQAAPGFEPIYGDLADTYLQLSEVTKALAVLREAEKRWPDDPDVHNAIGVIHVRRGALDDAVAAFSQAVEAAPGEALSYLNLARTYQLRHARGGRYVTSQRRWIAPEGDRQKAVENYRKYVEIGGPSTAQAVEALSLLEWGRQ